MEKAKALKEQMQANLIRFNDFRNEQEHLIKRYMDEVDSVFTAQLVETEDGDFMLENSKELPDYRYIHIVDYFDNLQCVRMIGMVKDNICPNTYIVYYLDDNDNITTCYLDEVATFSHSEILDLLTDCEPCEIQYLEVEEDEEY